MGRDAGVFDGVVSYIITHSLTSILLIWTNPILFQVGGGGVTKNMNSRAPFPIQSARVALKLDCASACPVQPSRHFDHLYRLCQPTLAYIQ